MTDITIPPAALEVGARAVFRTGFGRDPCEDPFDGDRLEFARKYARAAFLAIVQAWPGMWLEDREEINLGANVEPLVHRARVVLPLPTQENGDE